jgi:hypothetical protein
MQRDRAGRLTIFKPSEPSRFFHERRGRRMDDDLEKSASRTKSQQKTKRRRWLKASTQRRKNQSLAIRLVAKAERNRTSSSGKFWLSSTIFKAARG